MNKLLTRCVPAALLLTACSQNGSDGSFKDNWQDLQIKDLQQQLTTLRDTQAQQMSAKVASLIPSDKGYANLLTDAGTLAVSLQGVEPYADGSRVRLRIGNLTSGTITELRANIRWGPVDDKSAFVGEPRSDTWRKLAGPFPPGRWHTETLDLAGVPPAKLGKLELSFASVNSVSMPSE